LGVAAFTNHTRQLPARDGQKLSRRCKCARASIHKRRGDLFVQPSLDTALTAPRKPHNSRSPRPAYPLALQQLLENGCPERAPEVGTPFAPVEAFPAQRTPAAHEQVEF